MKYWFDTEFIEDGRTIDLISIGMVAEDGEWIQFDYKAAIKDWNSDTDVQEEMSNRARWYMWMKGQVEE